MNDLMPPNDILAEQAVLGSVLLSAQARREVGEVLAVEDFYRNAHQAIYAASLTLQQDAQGVDAITVAAELERRGELARIGTAAYLITLQQAVPTTANAGYYAEIVASKAVQRRMIEAGTRIVQMGYASEAETTADMVARARAELDKLSSAVVAGDVVDMTDLVPEALIALQQPLAPGYPTGFTDLDDTLGGGLHPGTLTVIGARPGVGKSILCLQFAAGVARAGYGALMFSLEMSRAELMGRFFADAATIELTRLHGHTLDDDDWRRLRLKTAAIATWPLAVADIPRIGLAGIAARARERAATARGLALVVVDYLQLVSPSDPKATREQQVSALSRGLKLLARELNVPVVAAAQLNRGPEQRTDKRPVLSDLRESGAIEADADTVMLLHEEPTKAGELEVILAKNRHGPKATVRLSWTPSYARARSLARSEYDE